MLSYGHSRFWRSCSSSFRVVILLGNATEGVRRARQFDPTGKSLRAGSVEGWPFSGPAPHLHLGDRCDKRLRARRFDAPCVGVVPHHRNGSPEESSSTLRMHLYLFRSEQIHRSSASVCRHAIGVVWSGR